MMVMMDIWWCRYLGWYIDPLLSKQHPWWLKTLGLGGQTTTFQVFANLNKCASCQQEYSHTSTFSYSLILKRIMTISITKNHQPQLILISCFANSADIYFGGCDTYFGTLNISAPKHIKCASSPSIYWHSVKTFANSWQKSLPQGKVNQHHNFHRWEKNPKIVKVADILVKIYIVLKIS